MKVILHSVNSPCSKKEKVDAPCGQSCDLLNNKAYSKTHVYDARLLKNSNVQDELLNFLCFYYLLFASTRILLFAREKASRKQQRKIFLKDFSVLFPC